ncbi:MAG: hypothetical protein KF767_17050 [Bdellovibrionaceae bacterium]|nr:hypothetical protein [Pseudobdellovibrionaceae bacterium]
MRGSTISSFGLGLTLTVALMLAVSANAAPKKKVAAKAATNSEYSTKMSFEGAAIKGKVQSGSLRKIVVENDKSIDDLLGVRKHFDDREGTEKGRVTTW